MEAREAVVVAHADEGREGGHRAGLVCLELRESTEIDARGALVEIGLGQRLEGAQRLGPPAQDKVADGSPAEVLGTIRDGRADA